MRYENDSDFADSRTRGREERPRQSPLFGWRDEPDRRSARPHGGPWSSAGSHNRDYAERSRGLHDRRDPSFGPDAYREGLARDETERLIASDKVEGTPVYDPNGRHLGSIHNFMVDKRSGQVVYAVLKNSRGFLGLDERYYPLHWAELTYDRRVDGYGVDLTRDELDSRCSFDAFGREIGCRTSESGQWGRGERFERGYDRKERECPPSFGRPRQ